MSEKIIHTAVQLVNRQRTRIPAMSRRDLTDLLLWIDFFTESKETQQRNQRIEQRYALYRCSRALSS